MPFGRGREWSLGAAARGCHKRSESLIVGEYAAKQRCAVPLDFMFEQVRSTVDTVASAGLIIRRSPIRVRQFPGYAP